MLKFNGDVIKAEGKLRLATLRELPKVGEEVLVNGLPAQVTGHVKGRLPHKFTFRWL